MIWSFIKILVFIGVAAGLTIGAGMIMETPGEVRMEFAGREATLSPLRFLIAAVLVMLAAWVLLKVVNFLVAILRFISGDQTAISRYFDRNRERKGFDALAASLIALSEGEGRKAQAKAQQAERLLNRPDLTRLISAQTAELNGNTDRALGYYKDMLTDDATRFVGIQGLLRQKLTDGDTDTALKLAEKAFAIRPRHEGTLVTLFTLQARDEDWAGARRTLAAKVRASSLPRDVGKRREAVLSLADARAALAEENTAKARDSAYAANRLAPTFGPAAALSAKLHAQAGEGRQAARIVKRAWTHAPHPDLAAAFAEINRDETPSERLKRFDAILKIRSDDPETRLVHAELALAAEDFPQARRALGDLAETAPTTRSLALMAAIERGEGAPETVVRGWLAKALEAPRGEAWVCEACNTAHGAWAPICGSCQSFDTMSWTLPPATDEAASATTMLPLIVGALQRPEPDPSSSFEPTSDPIHEPAVAPSDAVPDAAVAEDEVEQVTPEPQSPPDPVVTPLHPTEPPKDFVVDATAVPEGEDVENPEARKAL